MNILSCPPTTCNNIFPSQDDIKHYYNIEDHDKLTHFIQKINKLIFLLQNVPQVTAWRNDLQSYVSAATDASSQQKLAQAWYNQLEFLFEPIMQFNFSKINQAIESRKTEWANQQPIKLWTPILYNLIKNLILQSKSMKLSKSHRLHILCTLKYINAYCRCIIDQSQTNMMNPLIALLYSSLSKAQKNQGQIPSNIQEEIQKIKSTLDGTQFDVYVNELQSDVEDINATFMTCLDTELFYTIAREFVSCT